MSSQGPNFPSTGADVATVGQVAWSNPGNVTADDGTNATAFLFGFGSNTTHYLKATGFGFSIPSGATINGILVEWKVSLSLSATVQDNAARIVKGGTIGTTDKSSATAYTTTATYLSHGGSADLWGTTWTDTDINASTFGAALSCTSPVGSNVQVRVDACRITVTYTTAGGTVYNVSISEGATVGDTESATTRYVSSITDTGVFSDSFAGNARISATSNEGAKGGDAEATTLRAVATFAEGGKLGDSQLANIIASKSITEGSKGGDSQVAGLRFSKSIAEGLKASDTFTPNGRYTQTLNEGAALTDLLVGNVSFVLSLVDSGAFGDRFACGLPLVHIIGSGSVGNIAGSGAVGTIISGAGMIVDFDGSGRTTTQISGGGRSSERITN